MPALLANIKTSRRINNNKKKPVKLLIPDLYYTETTCDAAIQKLRENNTGYVCRTIAQVCNELFIRL